MSEKGPLGHIHEFSVDHEVVYTEDGPPQPRGRSFAWCECGLELSGKDLLRALHIYGLARKMVELLIPDVWGIKRELGAASSDSAE